MKRVQVLSAYDGLDRNAFLHEGLVDYYSSIDEGSMLTSKVAVIEFDDDSKVTLNWVLDQIGGISDLNRAERPVVVKVGVFSHKADNHTSVSTVNAIVHCFDKAPKIYLAESDNYQGTGTERLQIWKDLFTDRVVPFNLSDDPDTHRVTLAGEEMHLSRILFKPHVRVSTHILRVYEGGSILKNLFGCLSTPKKAKYHKVLPTLLADLYEAIGGVELAVLDGTYFRRGTGKAPVQTNTLLAGRDAVAVETVGATLAGLNPQKMPVMQEFLKRGLGEGNLENIELVGAALEPLKERFASAATAQKKLLAQRTGPQTWGGHAYQALEGLIREGFFNHPNQRTLDQVVRALEAKGLSTKGKETNISDSLARRVRKGALRKSKGPNGWVYWTE